LAGAFLPFLTGVFRAVARGWAVALRVAMLHPSLFVASTSPDRACSRYAAVRLLRLQEMRHTAAPHSLLTHPIAASVQGTRRRPKLAPAGLICPWHGIAHDELVVQPPGARAGFTGRMAALGSCLVQRLRLAPREAYLSAASPRACNIARKVTISSSFALSSSSRLASFFVLASHASTGSTDGVVVRSRRCALIAVLAPRQHRAIAREIARTHRRDARTSDSGSRSIAFEVRLMLALQAPRKGRRWVGPLGRRDENRNDLLISAAGRRAFGSSGMFYETIAGCLEVSGVPSDSRRLMHTSLP
jgi:hypothetical protein